MTLMQMEAMDTIRLPRDTDRRVRTAANALARGIERWSARKPVMGKEAEDVTAWLNTGGTDLKREHFRIDVERWKTRACRHFPPSGERLRSMPKPSANRELTPNQGRNPYTIFRHFGPHGFGPCSGFAGGNPKGRNAGARAVLNRAHR